MELSTKEKEKLELMKELGINHIPNMIEKNKKIQKEINKMTSLNFKPVNEKSIKERLCKIYFKPEFTEDFFTEFFYCLLLYSSICGSISILAQNFGVFYNIYAITLLIICITCITVVTSLVHKSKIFISNLSSWKADIPLGGLLAIKEAQKARLGYFYILYPVTSSSWAQEDRIKDDRIKDDPIIIGSKYGINLTTRSLENFQSIEGMYEIFSWDDGKIWDEKDIPIKALTKLKA